MRPSRLRLAATALLLLVSAGTWTRARAVDGVGPPPLSAEESAAIIAEAMAGKPRAAQPVILVVGGPMGGGKSTLVKRLEERGILRLEDFVVADADWVKQRIPFFLSHPDPKLASTLVHSQSAQLNWRLAQEAASEGRNVILFSSFWGTQRMQGQFHSLKKRSPNARTVVLYVDVPVEEAIARNALRPEKGENFVHPSHIRKAAPKAPYTFKQVEPLFDASAKIDNGGQGFVVRRIRNGRKRYQRVSDFDHLANLFEPVLGQKPASPVDCLMNRLFRRPAK